MSRNPIGLVIPCHRVVAATGLGGYGGSNYADRQAALAVKRRLLELEGALAADTKGAETTPEGTPGAMPGDTAGA
jgi:hypothetical protein